MDFLTMGRPSSNSSSLLLPKGLFFGGGMSRISAACSALRTREGESNPPPSLRLQKTPVRWRLNGWDSRVCLALSYLKTVSALKA